MDDWTPGDLALCVKPSEHLRAGAIYTVEAVCIGLPGYADEGELGLSLVGVTLPCATNAAYAWRFRKIAPHEPDAEDADTIFELVYAPSPAFTGGHQ